ncbi:hypothetical protein Tco_0105410 [Tanacetum coccineum]
MHRMRAHLGFLVISLFLFPRVLHGGRVYGRRRTRMCAHEKKAGTFRPLARLITVIVVQSYSGSSGPYTPTGITVVLGRIKVKKESDNEMASSLCGTSLDGCGFEETFVGEFDDHVGPEVTETFNDQLIVDIKSMLIVMTVEHNGDTLTLTRKEDNVVHFITAFAHSGTQGDDLLFCGSGTTASIKQLQEVTGIAIPSNLREKVVNSCLGKVIEIGMDEEGLMDIDNLKLRLPFYQTTRCPMLGSLSACSIVTGICSILCLACFTSLEHSHALISQQVTTVTRRWVETADVTEVPWSNERPLENKELNAIIGALTLLKSVLGALGTYFFSIYKAPKCIVNYLEKVRRNLFWGSSLDNNKIPWIAWKKVCSSKSCGGLEVGSFNALNLAMMSKWWWRFNLEKNSIWGRVITSINGPLRGLNVENPIVIRSCLSPRDGCSTYFWGLRLSITLWGPYAEQVHAALGDSTKMSILIMQFAKPKIYRGKPALSNLYNCTSVVAIVGTETTENRIAPLGNVRRVLGKSCSTLGRFSELGLAPALLCVIVLLLMTYISSAVMATALNLPRMTGGDAFFAWIGVLLASSGLVLFYRCSW